MKTLKALSGIMATIMTAAAMGVTLVASAADVAVKIGSDTKAAGENFSVTVDLSSVPSTGLSTIDFGINYDSSIISISDVALGTIGSTGAASQEGDLGETLFNWKDTGSQIVVVWATGTTDSNYWVKSNGTFLTITGKVAADAQPGASSKLEGVAIDRAAYPGGSANTDILFSAVGENNVSTDYAAVFTNGAVTVEGGGTAGGIVWGDADDNGTFEMVDLVMLAKASAGLSVGLTTAGFNNCNLVADSSLNGKDLTAATKLMAGSITEDQLPLQG